MAEPKKPCRTGKKIIYSVLAAVVFLAFFLLTYTNRADRQERSQVKVVFLGDSILGECRDETAVSELLSNKLGEPVFNGALGGTAMSRLDQNREMAVTKDGLSVQALSQAILTDDFGVQQTVRIREGATEYFDATIDALEQIDFKEVEALVIQSGMNDYHAGVPIENEEDPYDVYTFTGALRSTLQNLEKAYPDMKVILLTPTYSWYTLADGTNLTCEEYDLGGGLLEEYVEAEIQVAESMGVEIIDVYHDFYPHEKWSDKDVLTRDGLHPNETGRQLLADKIYESLIEE